MLSSGDSNKGTIIAAIIAVVGVIAIPLLSMGSPYISGPILHYIIIPSSDGRTAKISVGNNGMSPATNVTLTVIAPMKILGIKSSFGTDEIKTLSFNGTIMKAVIPKIVQGPGSLVEINLVIDAPSGSYYSNYTGYATYNQGSAISNVTDSFSETLTKYSWAIILIYVYVIFYIFLFNWVRNKGKLHQLIYGLIEIRNRLKNNSDDLISIMETLPSVKRTRKLIYEIPDYILVGDFYDLLRTFIDLQRNEVVVQNTLNEKCLESLEKVLNINWKKYQRTGLRYSFIFGTSRRNLFQDLNNIEKV